MPADSSLIAFRLSPDTDLKQALLDYCVEHKIDAACIVSCVGSLKRASIRFADGKQGTMVEGKLEIVSLSGTLSRHGAHLHISVADDHGKVTGGHLMPGAPIYTTAEVVLRLVPDVIFKREFDENTGHRELMVKESSAASYDNVDAHRKSSARGITISILFHVILLFCLLYLKPVIKKIIPQVSEGGTLVYLSRTPDKKEAKPKEKVTPSKPAVSKKQNVPLKQPKEIQTAVATPSEVPLVAPPPQEDMMSHIQAARQKRAAAAAQDPSLQTENTPPQESDAERANRIAKENIEHSLRHSAGNGHGDSGGMFEVLNLHAHSAELKFRGWSANSRRQNAQQHFYIDQGLEEDIQMATIKKVIEIIRTVKDGDFEFESQRLGHSVTLSARVADTAGLTQFLMREFFSDDGHTLRR